MCIEELFVCSVRDVAYVDSMMRQIEIEWNVYTTMIASVR